MNQSGMLSKSRFDPTSPLVAPHPRHGMNATMQREVA
jgi:hypothetical protein